MKNSKKMKLACILGALLSTQVMSQANDSFNYQGQLMDVGVPANDTYDIMVQMVDSGGVDVGTASTHSGVSVENGLFNIDVNIGGVGFDGFEDYFFEISVRKTSVGGAYIALSPVQALQSVPLASNLVNGDATSGQVLTFNGFQWDPADLPAVFSGDYTDLTNTPNLATVATSGSYSDLTGSPSLATVATSGSYSDLTGSPSLATVATSGDYNDLINTPASGSPLWSEGTSDGIYYNDGRVGIGDASPLARLSVTTFGSEDPMRIKAGTDYALFVDDNAGVAIGDLLIPPARGLYVHGKTGFGETAPGGKVTIKADGETPLLIDSDTASQIRKFDGTSVAAFGPSGTDDFYLSSVTGDLLLKSSLGLVDGIAIKTDGKVGVGKTNPNAKLHIDSDTGEDPFRVQVNGNSKIITNSNGGTALGANEDAPTNGLYVEGDVKQNGGSNGLMKYMVNVVSCGSSGVTIGRSYNGVNSTAITVADGPGGGQCVIDLPSSINLRFWQATAMFSGTDRGVTCTLGASNDKLLCTRFQSSTGNSSNGSIMVLIY